MLLRLVFRKMRVHGTKSIWRASRNTLNPKVAVGGRTERREFVKKKEHRSNWSEDFSHIKGLTSTVWLTDEVESSWRRSRRITQLSSCRKTRCQGFADKVCEAHVLVGGALFC